MGGGGVWRLDGHSGVLAGVYGFGFGDRVCQRIEGQGQEVGLDLA